MSDVAELPHAAEVAEVPGLDRVSVARAAGLAARKVPPAWPLAATVAVNPFLGQTGERLAGVSARLRRIAGCGATMPHSWFRERISSGAIAESDLAHALAVAPHPEKPRNVAELKALLDADPAPAAPIPGVADLCTKPGGTDWRGIVEDRVSAWASAYFDRGQALWRQTPRKRAWSSWRTWAIHDLTPEILGLEGFSALIDEAPGTASEATLWAARELDLPPDALDGYFDQILFRLGGWAQLARYELWQAELDGRTSQTLTDLLAVGLMWEVAFLRKYRKVIEAEWRDACRRHAIPTVPSPADVVDEILQDAADRAAARDIEARLDAPEPAVASERPQVRAVFCIDVRSEVYRRCLESVDASIRTSGFAGFFGVFTRHRCMASTLDERRFPVLLTANVASDAIGPAKADVERDTRLRHGGRAARAWRRFRMAAVSSFAFVEAMGPVYFAKLLKDALSLGPAKPPAQPQPRFVPPLAPDEKVSAAERVLRAMSMTGEFARLVLLVGHGASVVNNPHASALQCGACGGFPGDVNARLVASLLNDPNVRRGLAERRIVVPDDTLFVAALHDTTTDDVELFDADGATKTHRSDLARLRKWLEAAGRLARAERAPNLPRASGGEDVWRRARDWAETRPEWGLAGCKAFVAAPRARTAGRDLGGRVFLHDYDWRQDADSGYATLELILTAPVVVASWINLQYFGSCVLPRHFGAGNKLLHNVVGGVGVLEGNSGPLRVGLPWQSVHDGRHLVHEPVRLTVYVEAPKEAITFVLFRHKAVRDLFDNGWLRLVALGSDGKVGEQYAGDLKWVRSESGAAERIR
jgi:uncharacterized protein YbcC (UPF0753/DUF2309 family)